MTALITRNRNALSIFLQRGGDDFIDRAIVAQVNDLGTLRHQDAPHDVDRCVMAIEERSRCHEADFVGGGVGSQVLRYRQVGHENSPEVAAV